MKLKALKCFLNIANFLRTYFEEHLRTAASVISLENIFEVCDGILFS